MEASMTYFARYALLAVAVASLFIAGCTSSAICSCPLSGVAVFPVPAAATNPIVSVSADPPCTAMDNAAGGVSLYRRDGGICRGRAVLTNGDTYEFSVEFRATNSGCCGTLAFPIDASPPVLVDAGQD
jgi:hypothetical protein